MKEQIEKQAIEEMAKELTAYEKKLCERLPKDKCLLTSAVHAQVSCDYCKIAEFLVNAGYRKQEWISVDERLPEDTLPADYKHKTIKVLVAIKAKNGVSIRTQQRFLDYTYKDGKRTSYWTWRFSAGKVTHWMPLPKAPKGGAE